MLSSSDTSATGSASAAYDASLSSQTALLAAVIRSQCAGRTSAMTSIEVGYERLEELRQEILEALEEAREAEDDAGFFGDIATLFGEDVATIAAAIGTAAAVVGTGGAGAALVIAVLAAGLEVGAKYGAELGLDPRVAMAMGLAGAALGLCAGNVGAVNALAAGAKRVKQAAHVVEAAASGAGGAFDAVAQGHRSDALGEHAQISYSRSLEDETNFDIDEAIDRLERALSNERRATQIASSIGRNDDVVDRNLIANIGGAR